MVELQTYPTEQLPPAIKCQVLAFLRATWPEGFMGANRLRDWVTKAEDHPLSFVLVEQGILIGHANVVWKRLEHASEVYLTYGLTGVFTYPAFQGQGYGNQLVQAATEYIDQSDADIGLFHCDPDVAPFYERYGWRPFPYTETLVGPPEASHTSNELLMMRFISAKGRRNRALFEQGPLYFGSDSTW